MARLFDDASSQYLSNSNAIVSAVPTTFAAWIRPNAVNVFHSTIAIADSSVNTSYIELILRSNAFGQTVAAISRSAADDEALAESTSTYTANVWNHAAAVFASSSSRAVYLNGGNKGTDANDVTPGGLDITAIGVRPRSSLFAYVSGRVADAAIWDAALSDAEVASLAAGYAPPLIRPQSLVAYWPLFGNLSPEPDRVGGYDMTLNNAPTKVPHPPVIYPGPRIYTPSAAAIAAAAEFRRRLIFAT